jgi:monovalent cation:H+ antiporter, CPA1 family
MTETSAATLLTLLMIVAFVASIVRYIHIPFSVALVITGLALALIPGMPYIALTPGIILTIFLPILLFHGAYNLNLTDLRANLVPIAGLALPGVILTAALVGATLHFVTNLDWNSALLFGAIVGATDPVAVLAIFGEVGAPRRLSTLVAGESLFNDGTALVIFTALLGIATTHTFDPTTTIVRLFITVVGSIALGIGVGLAGSIIVQYFDEAILETTLTLIIAYGGYLLADAIHCSGPLETVAAALTFSTRGYKVMSPTTRIQARATWEFLDFLANSLLFLLIGLALRSIGELTATNLELRSLWWPLIASILAVLFTRIVVILLMQLILAAQNRPFTREWITILIWAGLRGAVSLAAALSIPLNFPARPLLLVLTFGVVLFTLLVQGMTALPLVTRLGVGKAATSHEYERLIAQLSAIEAAHREIRRLSASNVLHKYLAERLEDEYQQRIYTLHAYLDEIYHQEPLLAQRREQDVRLHLLRIERETVQSAAVQGQISEDTLRDVLAEIDRSLLQHEMDVDYSD